MSFFSSFQFNMCAHMERILHKISHTMLMAFIFALLNLNSGLTSHVARQQHTSLQNDESSEPYINRNLIMSGAAGISGSFVATALQKSQALGSSGAAADAVVGYSQKQLPPGSITATSSLLLSAPSSLSSAATINFPQTSGSSITSFDSTNVIDDTTFNQQQQQQQHQQSQSAMKNRPLHKVAVGVGVGDNQLNHNDGASVDNNNNNIHNNNNSIFMSPMYFGTQNASVVTTQIGATAHIPCTVHHIGDGVVSWIRKKDYHLLTVGLTTYSSDERFSATHLKHSEDWTLQIKFVQLRDAGVYECQVSTHPPTSIFLHLNVVEARAEISGPAIRYLTPGSTLRLQCRVVQNTEASEYIFWYHDNRMINYDIDRGINVSTEPDFQSSELTIQRTRREHSGNYTCVASNTQPASVLVHIFKGDNPAAMYHGHVGSSTKSYQTHLHCVMVLLVLGYRILHHYIHTKIT